MLEQHPASLTDYGTHLCNVMRSKQWPHGTPALASIPGVIVSDTGRVAHWSLRHL